uniref:Ion_trans_2 domain-containing protein n=1 Tax=Caenorhabditis tropicalis TaxID=1561998 RepID=A0A1I7TTA6_9PELO
MLERVKASTSRLTSATRSPCFHLWSPVILVLLTTVFILFGATCFSVFNGPTQHSIVSKWYINKSSERRQFAKLISSRIFNDTRNLLIIIDKEQTNRVQVLLSESLKGYEDKLPITPPYRHEWSWFNSFNFAYSLLLTVGGGLKVPITVGSQIFAIFYCLIGIPLFYSTLALIVYRLISPVLKWQSLTCSRRFLLILFIFGCFILWTLLIGICLYYQVLNDFWLSMLHAFTGSLTVQIPSRAQITSCGVLFLNFAATISVSFLLLILLVSLSIFFPKELLIHETEKAVEEKLERLTPPPKFQVIVDEAGESKLTTA